MKRRDPLVLASGAILVLMIAGATLVPMFARSDPLAIGDVLATRLVGPFGIDGHGGFHLLGTDRFGRDLFVRMMLAGRVSLFVGVFGSLIAAAGGTVIGAASGWAGGVIDRVTMTITDAMLAIPRLVLLLLCVALWSPGLTTVLVVLGATGWMGVARIVRSEVQGARGNAYVDAATAIGASERRTLWRHVLPNALGPAIVAATLGVGNAVLLDERFEFPRTWNSAAAPELGQHDRRRPRFDRDGAVGGARAGCGPDRHRAGGDVPRRSIARPGCG